jgi:phosphoribosyl-AMP cyclohydrolase
MPSADSRLDKIEETAELLPKFDHSGLITAVVTDADDGALLMVAHMNSAALKKTLETGNAWFWSRSRNTLWLKGETSGAILNVLEIRVDCDQDALWLKTRPQKRDGTCHTGRRTCFYRRINSQDNDVKLEFVE